MTDGFSFSEDDSGEEKVEGFVVVKDRAPLRSTPRPGKLLTPSPHLASLTKEQKAAWAFDELDTERSGTLPASSFSQLLELLGFRYASVVKPQAIAKCVEEGRRETLSRERFIRWYAQVAHDEDEDEFGFGEFVPARLDEA
jgi:hypothetical protein